MPDDAVNQEEHHPIVKKLAGYKREIIGATVTVLVLLVVYAIVSSSQKAAEQEAWRNIFVAMYNSQTQNKPMAQELEGAIKEARGAKAAFYAQMLLGSVLAEDTEKKAELEKAAAVYEEFVTEFPQNKFIGQVRVDYGTVLANLGKYDQAHTQYKFVIDNGPKYMEGEALLFDALAYQLEGKKEEALKAYAKVLGSDPRVVLGDIIEYAQFARTRLLNEGDDAKADKDSGAKKETAAGKDAKAEVKEEAAK